MMQPLRFGTTISVQVTNPKAPQLPTDIANVMINLLQNTYGVSASLESNQPQGDRVTFQTRTAPGNVEQQKQELNGLDEALGWLHEELPAFAQYDTDPAFNTIQRTLAEVTRSGQTVNDVELTFSEPE